jgi:hypothetical protein
MLIIGVATGPALDPQGSATQISPQVKNAAVQSLVRSTTKCIARAVASNARFGATESVQIGDLIVDAIPACLGPVRAMIEGYDRYYGPGTGESFFMGPYLDALPAVVIKWTADAAP